MMVICYELRSMMLIFLLENYKGRLKNKSKLGNNKWGFIVVDRGMEENKVDFIIDYKLKIYYIFIIVLGKWVLREINIF